MKITIPDDTLTSTQAPPQLDQDFCKAFNVEQVPCNIIPPTSGTIVIDNKPYNFKPYTSNEITFDPSTLLLLIKNLKLMTSLSSLDTTSIMQIHLFLPITCDHPQYPKGYLHLFIFNPSKPKGILEIKPAIPLFRTNTKITRIEDSGLATSVFYNIDNFSIINKPDAPKNQQAGPSTTNPRDAAGFSPASVAPHARKRNLSAE